MVTRSGFSQIVGNAFAGMGFPAENPSVFEFPMPMFDSGSDLTPLKENIDKVITGLTAWKPKITAKGVYAPAPVVVQGVDYPSAVDNMNSLFLRNLWSDDLPLVPPTPDRVKWILTGTDLPRDKVISPPGGVVARGGIASVEAIAVTLAMAGGRPEYMPVLIAAVKAITDPAFGLQGMNPTTNNCIPVVVVNGPIAKQIRLGSGYGLLGPDPQHPAGQVIGRAIRLIQQDLGGAVPGVGTMAIFGGFRATNAVFAEDEAGLPQGWKSYSVDKGFSATDSVVSATSISSMNNMTIGFGDAAANDKALGVISLFMRTPNINQWTGSDEAFKGPNHSTGVVLIARGFAAALASANGYSKLDVQTYLWKHGRIPWEDAVASGVSAQTKAHSIPDGEPVPITPDPRQITVVVAGGEQSGHAWWMQCGHGNKTNTFAKIELPAAWDSLLAQASKDLGPLPTW